MARSAHIDIGEKKGRKDPSRIRFPSLNAFSQALSPENRHLLALIHQHRPCSLPELERLSGRKASNLSRTLHTLSRYGLVELRRGLRGAITPVVLVRRLKLDISLVE